MEFVPVVIENLMYCVKKTFNCYNVGIACQMTPISVGQNDLTKDREQIDHVTPIAFSNGTAVNEGVSVLAVNVCNT